MDLNARIPAGPLAEKWDRRKFEMKLVNPANKRRYTDHRGRFRSRRRLGRGLAWRAGLQGPVLLLPGQPPSCALHRGPGRHQRGQELPERWRFDLAALLRHGEGRRFQGPRGQRVPPRPDQCQHHRPVCGAGRSVRAGIRRPARQSVVRWRPGFQDILRPGPDRAAAAAGLLSGAGATGRPRERSPCSPATKCST